MGDYYFFVVEVGTRGSQYHTKRYGETKEEALEEAGKAVDSIAAKHPAVGYLPVGEPRRIEPTPKTESVDAMDWLD